MFSPPIHVQLQAPMLSGSEEEQSTRRPFEFLTNIFKRRREHDCETETEDEAIRPPDITLHGAYRPLLPTPLIHSFIHSLTHTCQISHLLIHRYILQFADSLTWYSLSRTTPCHMYTSVHTHTSHRCVRTVTAPQ